MASDTLLHLEDEQRSRLNCVAHSSLAICQNAELLRYQETAEDDSSKYRRYGSRFGGVKVRHKRQVLQDMARPLKHWLYKHRDNPYPTKTEKVLLALGSHMTLVQVSNWFANARRRLKNTVRQPDLSWALRIKLYNKYIQGNAERLSVCSDDTNSDDLGRSSSHMCGIKNQGGVLTMADLANSDDGTSPPSKYKSSLLNRYLNDTLRHMMAGKADGVALKRRNHSESFSSNECDRDAVSPASSYDTDNNFIYQMVTLSRNDQAKIKSRSATLLDNLLSIKKQRALSLPSLQVHHEVNLKLARETLDYASSKCDSGQPQERGQESQNNQDWREINAAVALTSLAHGQSCQNITSSLGTTPGLSCHREPLSIARSNIPGRKPVTTPTSVLKQSCTSEQSTLTSRIIQKSSHISEVQTIKAGLANSV
ncbi:homeobox protein Mohawk-like isoform X2 [Syngnathus typhle]|uniref:homeobox protein Mohawk-like isoform X2 n=1 Tax=Syngnathus typhle TaxID=161592 RepID=UPI002A69D526|nr:homeobox protein Mohawk-like isoform X2 [Syngnathus typhle]